MFACFHLHLASNRIESVRIACGGVAATPRRAPKCEQALLGRDWNEATLEAAQAALAAEFTPIDDMRASAGYRRAALCNLLRRFYLETREPSVRTRVLEYTAR